MNNSSATQRISWYRSPVGREELALLNSRSDILGFLQTGGYLGLLVLTGSAVCFTAGLLPWWLVAPLVFFHGMCYNFMINGFHELVHDSVFKIRFLNRIFLGILSFLGWYNHIHFWASHMEHHKYTLHPPQDLEVVLPSQFTLKNFVLRHIINPIGFVEVLRTTICLAVPKFTKPWDRYLFEEVVPEQRWKMCWWSRLVLAGHFAIVVTSVAFGWWLLPLVVTFAPFYGGWLFFLCNNTQHAGLQDKVSDFRLNTRTVILNPFVRFLYWHMNYHIEHHMYAAVPCYHLGRLHKLIENDLPSCPRGLIEAWRQIIAIQKRQEVDPEYQFVAKLPANG